MTKQRHLTATALAAFTALTALLAPPTARAHITIDAPPAAAGSYARVVLRVPHGCAGSPTTGIAVYVPPGFLFAKALVKPGWTVSYERTALAAPIPLHGRSMTETTTVVRWQAGRVPNDQFDEFTLLGKLADDASGPLPFRVLQTCEQGETDWRGDPQSKEPAPVLQVTPAAAGGSHGGH